jgi:rubrerythrin
MDIFSYAMKMEMDGKAFYEGKANETEDPDIKQVLLTLAEEETRHYQYFKMLSENPDADLAVPLPAAQTLTSVQNIFESLAANPASQPFGDSVLKVWDEAREIEKKARAFYLEKAGEESDPGRKQSLLAIAEEENRHIQTIDTMLMYLKYPESFRDSREYSEFRSIEGRQANQS